MHNRVCKLHSMDAVDHWEAAERGIKAIKKVDKQLIKRKRRTVEKKFAQIEIRGW